MAVAAVEAAHAGQEAPVNKKLSSSILQKFNSMLATETHPPPPYRTNIAPNPKINKTGKQKLTKNSPITRRKGDSKRNKLTDNKKWSDSLKLWLSNDEITVPPVPSDEKKENMTVDRVTMTRVEP